jgi:hypothetical protein
VFILLNTNARGQDLLVHEKNLGFSIGLNAAFGTHFQRIGCVFNFFYIHRQVQANSELRAYFNIKSLGPKLMYPELSVSQGLTLAYGARQDFFNPFLSSVSNQTGHTYALSYAYCFWWNKRKTSQQTGLIALQFKQWSLVTENDILARKTLDRFRTAAFLVQFQYRDYFQAAINCTMWTGSMGHKQSIDLKQFFSKCYMDTTGGVYANTSHGLLSAQIKYPLAYGQNMQLNAGLDAEQVRNFVQNKVIHDACFVPRKWNKSKNCHIPMLDEKREPFLYGTNQKIKQPQPYLNVFSNAGVFY